MIEKMKRRNSSFWVKIPVIILLAGLLVVLYIFVISDKQDSRAPDDSEDSINGAEMPYGRDSKMWHVDFTPPDVYYEQTAGIPSENGMPGYPRQKDETGSNDAELKVIKHGDYLLALVTKETILKADYVPPDLMQIPSYMHPSYSMQLRAEALEHLKNLWQAAADDGVVLHIRSAYRSYDTQKGLFNDYASRHGEEEANRFSARPGQSEHQLGTAVDFGGTAVDFKAAFAETAQGLWLAENAWRFGFALSYPPGKEHITGYIFEPWHYRYIGITAAAEWKASGLTLKEYLELKPQGFQ